MSDYHRTKARAQEIQAQKEAEIKREIAAKKEKDVAAAKEAEARRKRLDEAAAAARRKELMAANAALTTVDGSNSAARAVEYNPFAEDEFAPSATAGPSQPKNKLLASGGRSGGSNSPAPRIGASRNGGTKAKERKEREITPPLLSRKEKAARAFAMQIKKQAKADGLASIRSLVETDERGGSSSPAPKVAARPIPQTAVAKKMIAPGKKGAADVNDLRKLAPGRDGWDRRSIDEIARDLRANRIKGESTSRAQSSEGTGSAKSSVGKRPRSISPKPTKTKTKPPPIPSSARPPTATKRSRPRSPSSSSSSSSSPRPARRRPLDLDPDDVADVSATIQALFRRPGGAPARAKYAASDASSDMEAGMSDVEEEERRAARIARREDELAEKEERERKEKKERMKRAAR